MTISYCPSSLILQALLLSRALVSDIGATLVLLSSWRSLPQSCTNLSKTFTISLTITTAIYDCQSAAPLQQITCSDKKEVGCGTLDALVCSDLFHLSISYTNSASLLVISVAAGDLLERCRRLAIIDSSGNSERDGKCLKKISTTLREAAPRGKEDESSSDVGHKRPREQEGLQDERTWTIWYDLDGKRHQSRLQTDITSRIRRGRIRCPFPGYRTGEMVVKIDVLPWL